MLTAILCAVLAALASFVGRLKGAPLVPGYAQKIKLLHDVVEPAFWAQAKLVRYLLSDVQNHGGVSGGPDNPSPDLHNSLATAAETLEKAHSVLRSSNVLDFTESISKAAEARFWHLAALLLAVASAGIQIAVWLSGR